jgi:hypothetical protein
MKDCHSAEGASKSKEKSSASAAKSGEAGSSKAKKRPSTSDTPGLSAAKVGSLCYLKLIIIYNFAET